MPTERLSALDASFLAVESPSAHMHVGWAATFAAAEHGPRPSFEELFAHIAGRLGRAPRYRQRVAPDALGLHAPLWVDAEDFDPAEHIHHSAAEQLEDLADAVLSEPLRARPPAVGVLDRARAGRRPHRPRRQGPSLHGRRPRRGRARLAAARRRAGARARRRGGRLAARAAAARARAGGARRVGPRARAARRCCGRRSQLARAPLALPRFARPDQPRAGRRRAPGRPAERRSTRRARRDRHLATARRPLDELRAIRTTTA